MTNKLQNNLDNISLKFRIKYSLKWFCELETFSMLVSSQSTGRCYAKCCSNKDINGVNEMRILQTIKSTNLETRCAHLCIIGITVMGNHPCSHLWAAHRRKPVCGIQAQSPTQSWKDIFITHSRAQEIFQERRLEVKKALEEREKASKMPPSRHDTIMAFMHI